jgi:hypothetical protein
MNAAVPSTARPSDQRSTVPADASPNAMAAHEIHLAHHHRHDFHRRDRQRGAEEDRGDEARVGLRQQRVRQHLAERKAADERQRHAGGGNRHRRAADPLHQLQIGFHAGQQQQHQNAELRHRIDHALLLRRAREQRVLRGRPDQAEHRRPEQKSADELSHHRRLAQPLRGLAHQAADQKQEPELGDEDRFRTDRGGALGRERRRRHGDNNRGKQKTRGTQRSTLRRIIRPDRPVACCHSMTMECALP